MTVSLEDTLTTPPHTFCESGVLNQLLVQSEAALILVQVPLKSSPHPRELQAPLLWLPPLTASQVHPFSINARVYGYGLARDARCTEALMYKDLESVWTSPMAHDVHGLHGLLQI